MQSSQVLTCQRQESLTSRQPEICNNIEKTLKYEGECLNVYIAWKDWKEKDSTDLNVQPYVLAIGNKSKERKHRVFVRSVTQDDSLSNQGFEYLEDKDKQNIHLIITIGGDGTILQTLSLFEEVQKMPWILSFQGGSFGFLCGFPLDDFYLFEFEKILEKLENKQEVFIEYRSRLLGQLKNKNGEGEIKKYRVLNEFVISRGEKPNIVPLTIWISPNSFKQEKDTLLLTESIGDGLIFSTPTGSTAYNLSAGGPIIQPYVNAMIMTPICPFSLSFRPLVLPSCTSVKLQVNQKKITKAAYISIDGKDGIKLEPSQEFIISYIENDLIFIVQQKAHGMFEAWGEKLNGMLHWNASNIK